MKTYIRSMFPAKHAVLLRLWPKAHLTILNNGDRSSVGNTGFALLRLTESTYLIKIYSDGVAPVIRPLVITSSRRMIILDLRRLRYRSSSPPVYTKPYNINKMQFEPETILIPGGHTTLGVCRGEGERNWQGRRIVWVSDFVIGKYEVTNREFSFFVKETGYKTEAEQDEGGVASAGSGHWEWHPEVSWRRPFLCNDILPDIDRLPVVMVSWNDAMAYTEWLSRSTGRKYRLPMECEWERAARGVDERIWPWGDRWDGDFSVRCNHGSKSEIEGSVGSGDDSDGYRLLSPVDAFPLGRSPFGAFDMVGNTKEWVYDDFTESRSSSPEMQRQNTSVVTERLRGRELIGVQKVLRGSGWYSNPFGAFLNAVSRNGHVQSARFSGVGFRVAEEIM